MTRPSILFKRAALAVCGAGLVAAGGLYARDRADTQRLEQSIYSTLVAAGADSFQGPAQRSFLECAARRFAGAVADEEMHKRWVMPLATLFKSDAEIQTYLGDRLRALKLQKLSIKADCAETHLGRRKLVV